MQSLVIEGIPYLSASEAKTNGCTPVFSGDFSQEPCVALGFIDPGLDHIVLTLTEFVCEAPESGAFPVIRTQLRKHFFRG